ncbi:MAG: hypothetical protein M3340_02620 [Actinomycetota bacterium]|nr:hypothetical protein [Actinomycetota bacterium]
MKDTFRIAISVAVVGAGMALAGAPSAGAHATCVEHTYDKACVNEVHDTIRACDGEADGHAVRAHWRVYMAPSWTIFAGSWDTTTNSGCVYDPLPLDAREFRICENDVGCSGWKLK